MLDGKVGTGGSSVEHLRIDIPDEKDADRVYDQYGAGEEIENNFTGREDHLSRTDIDPAQQKLINTASNISASNSDTSRMSGPPVAVDMSKGGFASPSSPTTLKNADADINIKPSKYDLSPTANNRRTFFNRTFSKLEKGSLRGGIFNMVSAALGGGVLALSYVFVLSGWVVGLCLLVIGGVAGTWSNLLIAKMACEHGLTNLDQMAFKAGGNCLRKFLQIMMLIYATGSCIGYQIFMGELLGYIFKQVLPSGDDDFLDSFEFRLCVNVPIAGVILLPLSLKRDMSDLAVAGIVSVGALCYTLLVMVIEMPFYWKHYREGAVMHAVKIDMNLLTSFSLVFFAYTCQMALLPVYSELVNPNYRRISKVIKRSLSVDIIFYLIIASAGYFSTFNATSDVVIQRDPLPGYTPDYTALAAAGSICLVLFAAFPVNYSPCRNQFFLLCYNDADFSNQANFVTTLMFIIVTCTVAVFYPNVSTVLSILGGGCSVSICYTVPLYSWVKLSKEKWTACSNLGPILFFSVLICMGYSSAIATIYMLATGKQYFGDRPDILCKQDA